MKSIMKSTNGFFILSVTLALPLYGCGTPPRVEPYHTQKFEQYKNVQIEDGVAVAVHPLDDPKEVEKYFGNDLLSEGVLPVFVHVENRHPTKSIVVSKSKTTLHPPSIPFDPAVVKTDSFGDGLFYVSLPLILGIGLPMNAAATVRDDYREDLRYNFEVSELAQHTLSPGKTGTGFVYFGVAKGSLSSEVRTVIVEIYNLKDGSVTHFNVPLRARNP